MNRGPGLARLRGRLTVSRQAAEAAARIWGSSRSKPPQNASRLAASANCAPTLRSEAYVAARSADGAWARSRSDHTSGSRSSAAMPAPRAPRPARRPSAPGGPDRAASSPRPGSNRRSRARARSARRRDTRTGRRDRRRRRPPFRGLGASDPRRVRRARSVLPHCSKRWLAEELAKKPAVANKYPVSSYPTGMKWRARAVRCFTLEIRQDRPRREDSYSTGSTPKTPPVRPVVSRRTRARPRRRQMDVADRA